MTDLEKHVNRPGRDKLVKKVRTTHSLCNSLLGSAIGTIVHIEQVGDLFLLVSGD